MKNRKFIPILFSLSVFVVMLFAGTIKSAEKKAVISEKNEGISSTPNEPSTDKGEMRGVWISYIELSMEGEKEKTEESFREKFEEIAENSKNFGFNTLFVQVRPYGDALYNSEYYPWSHILTGEQGKDPGYDPLKIMCQICRDKNLSIHAWINPYRVILNETPQSLSENNPYMKDKSIGIETDSTIIIDPSSEKGRELIINGVSEIIENYDVDGIQFDDYFYPTDIGNSDSKSYDNYVKKVGEENSMSIDNWRKANVNMLISQVFRKIKRIDESKIFGISPQGNLYNNDKLYADVVSWCTVWGFVDYICPQLYFSPNNPALTFEDSLEQWLELDFDKNVNLYIGLAGYKAGTDSDEGTWSESDDILSQEYQEIKECDKTNGFILYSYNSINDTERSNEMNSLKKCLN